MPIKYAPIVWKDNVPFSSMYNDVYFNTCGGIEESNYVFLKHNYLQSRWINLNKDNFVIAELGFGTALNFLNTWEHLLQFKKDYSTSKLKKMTYIGFEKHPLSPKDLAKAHSFFPTLNHLAVKLQGLYPPLKEGIHILKFNTNFISVDLILCFGDINDLLPDLKLSAKVDSWYLDGFNPKENADMWKIDLFKTMYELSDTDCHFATYCSASNVRKALSQSGFTVEKVKGFGLKREMLCGRRL